jgi:phosphopantothenoylcysteine synthetase/decarboxylase
VIFPPATYNPINKLALGITDNYALSRMNSAMAAKVPVVILPAASDFSTLPQYPESVRKLRQMSVNVLKKEENEINIAWQKALDSSETQIRHTQAARLTRP